MEVAMLKYCKRLLCVVFVLLLITRIECGRSGGGSRSSGGSRTSSHSTSHSSPSHSSSSHSSPSHTSISHSSPSHTSFGSPSHTSFGSPSHTSFGNPSHSTGPSHTSFGGGSHSSPPVTHVGPSAPHLPGYTVTGGAGFVPPHSTGGGTKPIGFDHVNQQASLKPNTGGIGFDHHQQTHNTPLHSGNPVQPPIHTAPPGYTVSGGTPIGFQNVNNGKPLGPPVTSGGFQQHPNPVYNGPPGYTVTGGAPLPNKPIGFDHVNQQSHVSPPPQSKPIGFDNVNHQAHNNMNPSRPITPPPVTSQHYNPVHTAPQPSYPVQHNTPTHYQPYRPQTVVQPGGYVHYQPPVQLQYAPPVTVIHHSTNYVPVYQPTVLPSYSSGGGSLLSHGGSFLGGYLVGRLTSPSYGSTGFSSGGHNTHVTNNYYNNDRTDNYYNGNSGTPTGNNGGGGGGGNSYYTVHHYHQNREQVPSRFTVPGQDLTQCQGNTTDQLCVPNTNAFCLKNGTIMCTTPTLLTTPCGVNLTERCVYSRIDCNGSPACNVTANQTYIDFYLPCVSNVTYVDNKVVDTTSYKAQGSYELCVTAIAHPKKLESPVTAFGNFFTEFSKWQLEQVNNYNNQTQNRSRKR